MAAGILVFNSLASAINAGYQVYDRNQNGYLVRIKTARGWAQAVVDLKTH